MSIIGVHALLYTSAPEEMRAVFRDVFGWEHVEAHPGWLIFKLPPAELGIHPDTSAHHEIALMCDDLDETVSRLRERGIVFQGDAEDRRFGRAVTMVLPGGVELMLYEPTHLTAI